MSEWLVPLNLKRAFELGSKGQRANGILPEWAGFLIWSGWWMRRTLVKDLRLFLVLLLPTRLCCSSLCALGALIASAGRTSLEWEEMLLLPPGTPVFLRYPDPKRPQRRINIKGIVSGRKWGRQSAIWIEVLSKVERLSNAKHAIFESEFSNYEISLIPHLSHQQEGRLIDAFQFYEKVTGGSRASLLSANSQCLLVTNRSAWGAQAKDTSVIFDPYGKSRIYQLEDLLMPATEEKAAYAGILVSSQKSEVLTNANTPLSILDGPEALRAWEFIKSPNLIVLLDQTEYEEDAGDMLALLSSSRTEKAINVPERIPDSPPPGIEMMIYALEQSTRP